MFTRAIVVLSIALASGATRANVILIDYGNAASTPTLGGTWNVIADTAGQALLSSAGAATGVTIAFSTNWLTTTVDQGPWPAGDLDWVDADATADYLFNTGGDTSTVVLAGLTPGAHYRFDHVAARSLGDARRADYLVNGAYADSTPNGNNFYSLADGWTAGDILVWRDVVADDNGAITLTVNDVVDFGYIGASRLELIIPTPASLAILALAGLGATRRRR